MAELGWRKSAIRACALNLCHAASSFSSPLPGCQWHICQVTQAGNRGAILDSFLSPCCQCIAKSQISPKPTPVLPLVTSVLAFISQHNPATIFLPPVLSLSSPSLMLPPKICPHANVWRGTRRWIRLFPTNCETLGKFLRFGFLLFKIPMHSKWDWIRRNHTEKVTSLTWRTGSRNDSENTKAPWCQGLPYEMQQEGLDSCILP